MGTLLLVLVCFLIVAYLAYRMGRSTGWHKCWSEVQRDERWRE